MPEFAQFDFNLVSLKIFLMTVFNSMIFLFVFFPLGLQLYLLPAAPVPGSVYSYSWKLGRFVCHLSPLMSWKHHLSLQKLGDHFIWSLTLWLHFIYEKKNKAGLCDFVCNEKHLWFMATLTWKMRSIDWNHLAAPCVTQDTFSMPGWSNPSKPLIHSAALSKAHPLLWTSQGAHRKISM